MTAGALVFYSVGLAGHATVEIVDRVFYAVHDTRTPVTVAVGAFMLNLVLSVVLMQTELNYRGLALANSLAALTEGGVLMYLLSRRVGGLDLSALRAGVIRILAASLIMGALIGPLPRLLSGAMQLPSIEGQAIVLVVLSVLGAVSYFAISAALRSEDLGALVRLVRGRA